MKQHYYSCDSTTDKDGYGKTACGRLGREVGGLIAYFFKIIKTDRRCKICDKRFKKDRKVGVEC